MSARTESIRRVARRALRGASDLPVAERIELLQDVAAILPREEAQVAKDTALALKRAEEMQRTFFEILTTEAKS